MTHPLVAWADQVLPDLLKDIEQLVRCESPSADHDAVARSADVVAGIGKERIGVAPERIVIDGFSHLRWALGSTDPDAPRVLLLAHHDTVWPVGSLQTTPYSVGDGVLRGPGCFDMLTGLAMAIHVVGSLRELQHATPTAAVTLLVTGDEEIGSPSSRALIEQGARECRAALVLEASADGGALKIGRKGVSLYQVELAGRASHAGLEPEAGLNATIEMAHQIGVVAGFAHPERGTTVTPTLASAGSTMNTVPAHASFAVDVRTLTAAEQERVDRAIRSLESVTGTKLFITGGINRPPLESAASAYLWRRFCAVAEQLHLPPVGAAVVGGASDGNFTAGMGVPTLDGLGAVGGGAHSDQEHVIVADIPRRTALLAGLVRDLLELNS